MNGKRLSVLIVEDNPGDAFMVEQMLRDLKLDMKITLAEDGQEALDILVTRGNDVPDLVILDLNMPRVDGFEVLKYMKDKPMFNSVPVVVMTGSLRGEDEKRSRDLGAVDYCVKPATSDEMERTTRCLRHNLELLPAKEKDDRLEPKASMSWKPFPVYDGDRRITPPFGERLVIDNLNLDPWKM
jgi:CheY-like chemotaxis protein